MPEHNHDRTPRYAAGSLSLTGAVAMGTGVMIGAGIFALTGQLAEHAGRWFPLAFLAAAVVTAFSAHAYVRMSSAYPSAGGIAMYLEKAYGRGVVTAVCALLMYFSMVINESLVARTFGNYTLQLFDLPTTSLLVPVLGVGLLALAFLVNVLGNRFISAIELITALLKIGGIGAFALAGLWLSGFSLEATGSTHGAEGADATGFLAAVAIGILAYKGFTTITNSGSEIADPHRNVGRAIVIAIAICTVLYGSVALAVAGNLEIGAIIEARDFALAEAARPAFGSFGLWFTVLLAVVATVSGVIASTFAVSRMLAMLTDMKLVPHSHFGMSGTIQRHTLVYTVVLAMLLTVFFDLSRIAALGAIFYIVMDLVVQWGVLRNVRREVDANPFILITAIALDAIVLTALIGVKWQQDPLVVIVAAAGMTVILGFEAAFLRQRTGQ